LAALFDEGTGFKKTDSGQNFIHIKICSVAVTACGKLIGSVAIQVMKKYVVALSF